MRVDNSAVQYSVNRVDVEGQKDRTVWKIDSSLQEVEQLEDVLQEVFPVATHSVAIGEVTEKRIPVAMPPGGEPAGTPEPKAAGGAGAGRRSSGAESCGTGTRGETAGAEA